jgi:cholesterol transport system auxiliary component
MITRAGMLLAMAFALAGCTGSLLESNADAPETYRLVGEALADRGARQPLALAVARPRAASALDTQRIAVVQPDSRFDYFAGLRWSEAAPQMVQQQLVRALTADGRFEAVVAAPSRVPSDLLLDVELRRFEAVYAAAGTPPEVRVELQVSLVDTRQVRRLVSFTATGAAPAGDNGRASVVAAFERATNEAVRSVVDQVRSAAPAVTR